MDRCGGGRREQIYPENEVGVYPKILKPML